MLYNISIQTTFHNTFNNISNVILIFLLQYSHFIALALVCHKVHLFNGVLTLELNSLPERTLCLRRPHPFVSHLAQVHSPCRCLRSGITNRVAPNNLVTALATPPRILGSILAHALAPSLHFYPQLRLFFYLQTIVVNSSMRFFLISFSFVVQLEKLLKFNVYTLKLSIVAFITYICAYVDAHLYICIYYIYAVIPHRLSLLFSSTFAPLSFI